MKHIFTLCILLLVLPGCAVQMKFFPDATDPLQEYVLEGKGHNKIAYITCTGIVSDSPSRGIVSTRPSMVDDVVSRLKLAEADPAVKAVVLAIDSPGGSATASDVLYYEINTFKARSGKKVVAVMLDMAASGGYYIALPADRILAHPTTVTGSVGAVFYQPRVSGLMDKIGVEVEVARSGRNKDMGSPFRQSTDEEREITQGIIDKLAGRFLMLTQQHRNLSDKALAEVGTARVFTGPEALSLGLVDQIGYLADGFAAARELAGLPEASQVVVYRRELYPNDNPYNTQASAQPYAPSLLGVDANWLLPPRSGFNYLWLPGQ
ncbi:MAG: signal peptide peptidase SppA [Proteobacteria bacterium]|nr:signal peptide peptidase SppA [Pseudomonadota bacterium]MBU1611416.1 signal peptide peptidase SppA [Pseudomonadota bacterium]